MRIVKRVALWLLFVAVLCAALVGGVLYVLYRSADAQPDTPAVTLGGQALPCVETVWHEPVLNGLFYKEYRAEAGASELPAFTSAALAFEAPPGASCEMTVTREGESAPVAAAGASGTVRLASNGRYTVEVLCSVPKSEGAGYGTFRYRATFTLAAQPAVELSAERIEQGGVVAVNVSGIMDGSSPSIETELSQAVFVPTDTGLTAYIGIAYNREPGDYAVTVRCGEFAQTCTVTVVHRDYARRLDASAESGGSVTEWQNAIFPTFTLATPERLWSGRFSPPCTAAPAVGYGDFLLAADGSLRARSAGLDYALAAGEALAAPADGKVAFAGTLSLTGGTVVIDHGAGLKSYFYHLDGVQCQTGDAVTAGQAVGAAGAAPAHYEARIGNQSVDPVQLFEGTSGLYWPSALAS